MSYAINSVQEKGTRKDRYSPLHIAAHQGHLDIIKLLLRNQVMIFKKRTDF